MLNDNADRRPRASTPAAGSREEANEATRNVLLDPSK